MRLLLRLRLGRSATQECSQAAAGWGGDAMVLYEKGSQSVLAWITEWDTPQDAQEFLDTAGKALRQGWALAAPAPTRVTLVGGTLPPDQLRAVQAALAGARAIRPANRRVDLAALGITAQDRPQKANLGKMLELLKNPALNQIVKGLVGGDFSKVAGLLDDPDTKARLEQLASGMLGEGGLEALLKNPAFQKMLEEVLAGDPELPKGRVAGGAYTNPKLGFTIRAPKAAGWTVEGDPDGGPLGPRGLVRINAPGEGKASVVAALQKLPMAMPAEGLGPFIEMGVRFATQDYQKLSEGLVTCGAQKGAELEYTGKMMGQPIHCLQRIFVVEGRLVMVAGMASLKEWEQHGAGLREALGSIVFSEPEKPPQAKPEPKAEPGAKTAPAAKTGN